MARLILELSGERRELRFTGPITIGRSKTSTIHVDDMVLSREHTLFYTERSCFFVRDLESKNGTFLNGNLLRNPEMLRHGDRVKAGPALFTFVSEPGDVFSGPATQTAPTVPATVPAAARPPAAPPAPPAPPAPARARPRTGEVPILTPSPIVKMVISVFLLGVIVVGAYFSRFVFSWLLDLIPR